MDKHVEADTSQTTPINPFASTGGDIPAAWVQPAQRFASALAAMNAEIMRFASRRLESHGKAWEACAKCTDLSTLTETQTRFLGNMVADYASEAAELVRRTQDIMASAAGEPAK